MSDSTRPVIGFIGAGRTANALAKALIKAGYRVAAVASRSGASARELAAKLPDAVAVDAREVVAKSDLIIIATPDASIREVAEQLTWRTGMAIVHTSGVETSAVLQAAAGQGAATGSLHPLQTFADKESGVEKLAGSAFAIEADGELKQTLTVMVEALGGVPLYLRAEDKALYHASAVLASNYVVTLSKLASDLWLTFGWERSAALKALLPLMQGAIDNLGQLGLPQALTGPVARGDVESVSKHLEALHRVSPETLEIYRRLAEESIPLALARGELSNAKAEALRDLLRPQPVSAQEGTRS